MYFILMIFNNSERSAKQEVKALIIMKKIERLRQHNLTRECKQFQLINKFILFYNNNCNTARTQ